MSRPVATLRVAPPAGTAPTPGPKRSALLVDEWGRDVRMIRALSPLAHIRWNVTVTGQHRIGDGGALIVVNARRFALSPIAAAWALSDELDRPVRFVGRPDIAPFGPLLRCLGGLLALPAEVAGALRSGEVVVTGAGDSRMLAAAGTVGVPVHLAAMTSSVTSRRVTIDIGPPQSTGAPRTRRRVTA